MQIEQIPLSAIQLDERNPRIASGVEGLATGVTEEFMELALGRSSPADEDQGSSTTYSSLKASIRAQGGLITPIIVRPANGGKYLVVEGNTRVAIFRELFRESGDEKWQKIPSVVHLEASENDEHAIRLQAHLVGPRPWKAYAKGKYLHYLYHDKNWSLNELLDFCGGNARKREIEEYIDAYADMHSHYSEQLQAGLGYSKFSAFVELQKPGIKQAIARAGFNLSHFADWLANGNIVPLAAVRQLPRILPNQAARKAFLEHDTREAMKLLDQPNAGALLKDVPLEQLATALAARIRTEPYGRIKEIIDDRQGVVATALIDAYGELGDILKAMDPTIDAN